MQEKSKQIREEHDNSEPNKDPSCKLHFYLHFYWSFSIWSKSENLWLAWPASLAEVLRIIFWPEHLGLDWQTTGVSEAGHEENTFPGRAKNSTKSVVEGQLGSSSLEENLEMLLYMIHGGCTGSAEYETKAAWCVLDVEKHSIVSEALTILKSWFLDSASTVTSFVVPRVEAGQWSKGTNTLFLSYSTFCTRCQTWSTTLGGSVTSG